MKRKLMLLLACLFVGIGLVTAQTQNLTGVVISEEDGQPVIGASIAVKGTSLGTITDVDGKFSLSNVPSSAKTLQISYIGMQTQEVAIKANLQIVLKTDAQMMEEVVVIGYGTAKKLGSVVGSVATVDNKKLKNQPTANFTDALQGQVAGLSVLSSSGEPTQVAEFRLRGINSIFAGTTPLFILDGAPITSTVFNSLNPTDIENITILKDAASTSIYGSRAANGVIVITSKKGKMNQKAQISLRAQYGVSNIIDDRTNMMNASQYIQFRKIIKSPIADNVVDIVNKNHIDTNWTDYIFESNAPTYQVDLSVNGGSESINYYISLGHMNMKGIEPLSELRRETLRSNFEARVNSWFKVGLQSNVAYTQYQNNPEANPGDGNIYEYNPAFFARKALPIDSPLYYTLDENNNATFGDRADYLHYSKTTNPIFGQEMRNMNRNRISANLNLYEALTPLKGLTIRAQQAIDAYDYRSSVVEKPTDNYTSPMGDYVTGNDGQGYRSESFTRYYNFTYTNTAEYKFDIKQTHNITFLLGQEAIIAKSNGFGASRDGITDMRQSLLTHATETPTVSQSIVETVFNSLFLHGDYNYKEKYYFDATYRRDGSSRFAPGHRWANFYSLGAKWDIKKESFMSDFDWINALSMRLSYGTTGNSSIDDYQYFGLVSGTNIVYKGEPGMDISQASNYDLTWETVAGTNLGLSFRLFDRFSIDADFYRKKTSDMLMSIPYSFTTGFSSGYGNIGAMTNVGVDIELNVDILRIRDFYWGFKANVNYNKNKITELFNGKSEYALPNYGLNLKVGSPFGEFYMVKYLGVDPRDGKQLWEDCNGNPTKVYNEERDSKMTGKQQYAPWTGGFSTNISWKGINIGADFSWVLGKYALNNDRYFYGHPYKYGTSMNQSAEMLGMWTTPGQKTYIPAYTEEMQFDTHLLENASFLRLKNLSVGYTLPKRWLKKTNLLEGVNVYFTGRNLLTATKFTGYDPEPDTNVIKFNYPNTRQFVFGAEITF